MNFSDRIAQFLNPPPNTIDRTVELRNADPYPGVRDATPETQFLPPEPDLVALPRHEPSAVELLEDIRNSVKHDDQRVVWRTITQDLGTGTGEGSFDHPVQFRHVFIPSVPRNMFIWAGSSRNILLGYFTVGQRVSVSLPIPVDGISVAWESGASVVQFVAYLSSAKVDINVQNASEDNPDTYLLNTSGILFPTEEKEISGAMIYGQDGAAWRGVNARILSNDALGSVYALSVIAHQYAYNGATWDRLRGDIANGLDVDVTRMIGSGSITTANISVGVTAVLLSSARPTRRRIIVKNLGTVLVYIGPTSGVTTTNGYALAAGESKEFETTATVYGISGTAAQDVRLLEEYG